MPIHQCLCNSLVPEAGSKFGMIAPTGPTEIVRMVARSRIYA